MPNDITEDYQTYIQDLRNSLPVEVLPLPEAAIETLRAQEIHYIGELRLQPPGYLKTVPGISKQAAGRAYIYILELGFRRVSTEITKSSKIPDGCNLPACLRTVLSRRSEESLFQYKAKTPRFFKELQRLLKKKNFRKAWEELATVHHAQGKTGNLLDDRDFFRDLRALVENNQPALPKLSNQKSSANLEL